MDTGKIIQLNQRRAKCTTRTNTTRIAHLRRALGIIVTLRRYLSEQAQPLDPKIVRELRSLESALRKAILDIKNEPLKS